MQIRGPLYNLRTECESILRSLPRWFGDEDSLVEYAQNTDVLPTFVATNREIAIAFLSLRQHSAEAWEIDCVAVHCEYRRQGIGVLLLAEAERWLIAQGASLLQVKTLAASHPSLEYAETRTFYQPRGFLPLEEFPLLWGKNLPVLLLVRVLPGAG